MALSPFAYLLCTTAAHQRKTRLCIIVSQSIQGTSAGLSCLDKKAESAGVYVAFICSVYTHVYKYFDGWFNKDFAALTVAGADWVLSVYTYHMCTPCGNANPSTLIPNPQSFKPKTVNRTKNQQKPPSP